MLHHEESPEKPEYNTATSPPFLDKPPILCNPPFSSKNFQTPPISISFEKVEPPPPLYEGGVQTMSRNDVSLSFSQPSIYSTG